MRIKEAEMWLRLGWEVTRNKWKNEKHLVKYPYTPYVEVVIKNKPKK